MSVLLATGGTYTLCFAIVENQGQLQLGIHNVILQTTLAPVPEADTLVMLLAGLGVIGLVARRRKTVLFGY